MEAQKTSGANVRAMAAAALLALAVALGVPWTLGLHRDLARLDAQAARLGPQSPKAQEVQQALAQLRKGIAFDWIGVGAAGAGAALLLVIAAGRPGRPWLIAAAVAPVAYVLLDAAPGAASLEALPLARLAAAVAATLAYVLVALSAGCRLQYVVCCATVGVGAVFFTLWEPPPPKPVPIAKPLAALEANLLAAMPGWTGHDQRLTGDVEKVLGADEYLNLRLESKAGGPRVDVFVTYNANAMSNVPHVPWVCMTQAGYELVGMRQDDLEGAGLTPRKFEPNVLLFRGGQGRESVRALMFQYFNVGGTYTASRQMARFLATTGSLGRGSYLSQTQVIIWLPAGGKEDPLEKNSPAYRLGLEFLRAVVPLLEREHYPDLGGAEGG